MMHFGRYKGPDHHLGLLTQVGVTSLPVKASSQHSPGSAQSASLSLVEVECQDWRVESQCPAMGSHFIVAVVISLCCQPVIVVSGELQLYWFTGEKVYIEII